MNTAELSKIWLKIIRGEHNENKEHKNTSLGYYD